MLYIIYIYIYIYIYYIISTYYVGCYLICKYLYEQMDACMTRHINRVYTRIAINEFITINKLLGRAFYDLSFIL